MPRNLLWKWLARAPKTPIRRPARPVARPSLTPLEDRTTPANVVLAGTTIAIDLTILGEQLTVVATGADQITFIDTLGFTGDVTAAPSFSSTGLTSVTVTDSAANTSVAFADSGANAYAATFGVTLDGGSNGVAFFGTSDFNTHPVSVTADRTVLVNTGAAVKTSTGGVTLDGNFTTSTAASGFNGVVVNGNVASTGTGPITLQGTGGSSGSGINLTGSVTGGTGPVVLTGIGSGGAGGSNHGVVIDGAGTATSAGGSVQVSGQGGAGVAFDVGVLVENGGTISAGGAGAVTVTGTGGAGDFSSGVLVQNAGSRITSSAGPVQVSGAASGGPNARGIDVAAGGLISSGGTAPVTLSADGMNLFGLPSVVAGGGAGVATVRPLTAGTTIALGDADAPGQLGLTDLELDSVQAGVVRVGSSTAGDLQITTLITPGGTSTLSLIAGGTIINSNKAAGVQTVNLALLGGGVNLDTSTVNQVSFALAGTTTAGDFRFNGGSSTLRVGAVDGVVGVTANGGDVGLAADSGIILNQAASAPTGTVNLFTSIGPISDENGGGLDVVGAAANLTALFDIGAAGDPIELAVGSLTAVSTFGGVFFAEADGLTLASLTANGPFGQIVVSSATGDIAVGSVATLGNVTLSAPAGNIIDDGDDTTAINGDGLTLTAFRAIGQPGALPDLDVAVNTLVASTTGPGPFVPPPNAGMWVTDANDLTVISATTTDGVIRIDAVGQLNAASVTAGGTGRNVGLQALGGDLTIGSVTAAGDTVSLSTPTLIVDGDAAIDVTALRVMLSAGGGIGAAGDPLETAVAQLAAAAGTGDVFVANTGALTITAVTAFGVTVTGVTGALSADVSAASPLTIAADVVMGGDVTLTAGETDDDPACADVLTVNPGVTVRSTGGDVTLRAGDDVVLGAGSTVAAAGVVALIAGFGDLDACGAFIDNGAVLSPGTGLTICTIGDLTVGTITAPGQTVTLRSVGGAVVDGNGAALNVTAAALAVQAAAGVGTAADPLETGVAGLEALTDTGGLFLSNTGDLTVGGVTPDLSCIAAPLTGLAVTTSGDLVLDNAGGIFLADTDGAEVVRGGGTSGNVSLDAHGATADVLVVVDNDAVTAPAGSITLIASRDILLGTAGAGFLNDVRANGSVTLSAGRDVTVDGFADVASDDFGNDTGGGVTVTAGGDVSVTDTQGAGATVAANGNGGSVVLTTGAGGTFTLTAPSTSAVFSNSGSVTVNADRVVIGAASGITANSGSVTIQPVTAGQAIDLGSATDAAAGTLELSDAELDRVFSPLLRIGDAADSGDVTITAPLTLANATTLALRTAGAILSAGAGTAVVANLALAAGTGVGPLTVQVGKLAATTIVGPVEVTNVGDLLVGTVDGVAGVTGAGAIVLTAAGLGATLTNAAAISGSPVTLAADRMALAGGTITAAGGGRVTVRQTTAGRLIDLGSATDAAVNTLELSDAELDTITAGTLQVGNTSAGTITVTAPISPAGAGTLDLETGAAVADGNATGADVTVANLALRTGGGVSLDTAVSNLAFANTGGAVAVRNSGALTIAAVDGLATSSNTGTTTAVSAASPLTIAVNTITVGDTTYTAGEVSDAPTFADDLTVNAGVLVNVTAGNLTLRAGDDIILESGSTASASGTVALLIGFGDLDGHGDGVIRGTISAGAGIPTVTGGAEDNTLLVDFANGAALPGGLDYQAGAGADSLTVSDAGDGVNTHAYVANGAGVTRDGTTVSTTGVESVAVNGGELADTFTVTPSASTTFAIDGNNPIPPASPGDTLTVDLTGTTNPILSVIAAGSGFQGAYTFADRQPVTFTEIETLGTNAVDLRVTKDDGQTTAVPGTTVTYTIVFSNVGALGVTNVAVTDVLPAGLTGVTWTSVAAGGATGNTATGSGDIAEVLTLPAGGSVTYTVTGTLPAGATGTLSNTATVTAPPGTTDTTPADNSATDTDTVVPTVDVRVTKTDGRTTVVPGTTVTYTIVVSNPTGPSTAAGVSLSDLIPAGLTGVTWTSVAAGGATGNRASGAGSIADTLTLPVGGTVTYTLTGTVSPSATGTLSNTATAAVAAGTTDTDTANNAATDADTLTPTVDVRVTKTDGLTTVAPGVTVTYTIVVSNIPTGPSTAAGVTLTDVFPTGLTGVTWTSAAAGGATGNTATGAGSIFDTLTLPPGASVTYTVTGTVSPTATGTLTNTAVATVVPGTTDTDLTNNSATDGTTILPPPPVKADQNEVSFYGVGTGTGGPGNAEVRFPNGTIAYTVNPLGADGVTGVRIAVGDVTGDGVPDVVAGTGPGVLARFVVLDGVTKSIVRSVQAFEDTFTGGTFVAVADVDGDGFADVAVSADVTGGSRVRVFSGKTGIQLADFLGIEDPAFRGGARVGFGDLNGDGTADLIVAAGFGGGPRVAIYDGLSVRTGKAPVKMAADFFIFETALRDGAYVTAGDLNGDGFADLIAGGGPSGGPRVFAVDGKSLVASRGAALVQRANFFADDPEIRSGIRLSAKDFDGDNLTDLVVTTTDADGPHIATFLGKTIPVNGVPPAATSFDIYPGLLTGVFVG